MGFVCEGAKVVPENTSTPLVTEMNHGMKNAMLFIHSPPAHGGNSPMLPALTKHA